MKKNRLYFAYGSNLNAADLRSWCRRKNQAEPLDGKVSNAWLPDWELVFNYRSELRDGGALNIRPRQGQVVPGVLFRVQPGGWRTLNQKEGAIKRDGRWSYYEPVEVSVLNADGEELRAVTYKVVKEREAKVFIRPNDEYDHIVREGLACHGIDEGNYLCVAADRNPPWVVSRLFCYGTLMHGEVRHGILTDRGSATFLEDAWTLGRLFRFDGFPGMLPSRNPEHKVAGEVYQVADVGAVLQHLDRIEGFRGYGDPGGLFRRAILRVQTKWGESLAWAYVLRQRPDRPAIETSSKWRRPVEPGRASPSCGLKVAGLSRKESPARQRTSPTDSLEDRILHAGDCMKTLAEAIEQRRFPGRPRPGSPVGWGGADVVFTTEIPNSDSEENSFYPRPRTVVSPFAHQAGWLLRRLWFDGFGPLFDSCSKIEFFGRLANAALRYQEKLEGKKEDPGELLQAILGEAERILQEIDKKEFGYLTVAVGNRILDDMKNQGKTT